MPAPAGTVQTYGAIGNREDLSNIIYKIAPTKTPFLNMCAKTEATSTLHEWQTQDLATPANNAQLEGDNAPAATFTPTVRLNNRTQISTKLASISGSQEKVKKAGRSSEMAYQIALKGEELKRDMETGLTQNTTLVVGSGAVGRQSRGLEGWIRTNNNFGAGGVAPDYINNIAPTDGTARAFTEAQLKDVCQQCFTQGGDPNMIFVGATQKQTFSTFTGNSTGMREAEDKKLTAAIDVYVSDFGTLKVAPNRFQRTRTAFVLQSDMWKIAYLRPFQKIPLAKVGDSEQNMLVVEYSLEACQEKSSGAIRDIL